MIIKPTGWPQKFGTICLYSLILSNINRFSNFFTVRIRIKFAIIQSLKIPPHLKCVATLPCKMSLNGANYHSVSLITPLVSASPAWMCHPAAMWTHWTFDVTSGSAMAEGPRDALVSRNSATTKHPIWKIEFQVYRVALFAWSYV